MFQSNGLKRLIAGGLLALANLIQISGIPQIQVLVPILMKAAAALGAAGLLHAGISGSFKNYILASLAALVAAAQFIPGLESIVPFLQYLGGLLGAAAIGQRLASNK